MTTTIIKEIQELSDFEPLSCGCCTIETIRLDLLFPLLKRYEVDVFKEIPIACHECIKSYTLPEKVLGMVGEECDWCTATIRIKTRE